MFFIHNLGTLKCYFLSDSIKIPKTDGYRFNLSVSSLVVSHRSEAITKQEIKWQMIAATLVPTFKYLYYNL